MGVFLYDDLVAIVSLRYQKIHILQLRDSGNLVDLRSIGEYCREDDELFLNSSAQASGTSSRSSWNYAQVLCVIFESLLQFLGLSQNINYSLINGFGLYLSQLWI